MLRKMIKDELSMGSGRLFCGRTIKWGNFDYCLNDDGASPLQDGKAINLFFGTPVKDKINRVIETKTNFYIVLSESERMRGGRVMLLK